MQAGEITDEQAIREWTRAEDTDAERESTDLMKRKYVCVCCYLKGNEEYMLDARDFGVKVAGDFYEKYVSQGRWTRYASGRAQTQTFNRKQALRF